jgi:hypothetical protein
LTIAGSSSEELDAKLKALSLERGDTKGSQPSDIKVVEKDSDATPKAPMLLDSRDSIEGHRVGR